MPMNLGITDRFHTSHFPERPEIVAAVVAALPAQNAEPETALQIARRTKGISWRRVYRVLEALNTSSGPVQMSLGRSLTDSTRSVTKWKKKKV